MKTVTTRHTFLTIRLLIALIAISTAPALLIASPGNSASASNTGQLKYKVISGYRQQFNDTLQSEFSKGWTPVGGVSVTSWNNALYFAQLISKSVN
jgi:hypothetical protein